MKGRLESMTDEDFARRVLKCTSHSAYCLAHLRRQKCSCDKEHGVSPFIPRTKGNIILGVLPNPDFDPSLHCLKSHGVVPEMNAHLAGDALDELSQADLMAKAETLLKKHLMPLWAVLGKDYTIAHGGASSEASLRIDTEESDDEDESPGLRELVHVSMDDPSSLSHKLMARLQKRGKMPSLDDVGAVDVRRMKDSIHALIAAISFCGGIYVPAEYIGMCVSKAQHFLTQLVEHWPQDSRGRVIREKRKRVKDAPETGLELVHKVGPPMHPDDAWAYLQTLMASTRSFCQDPNDVLKAHKNECHDNFLRTAASNSRKRSRDDKIIRIKYENGESVEDDIRARKKRMKPFHVQQTIKLPCTESEMVVYAEQNRREIWKKYNFFMKKITKKRDEREKVRGELHCFNTQYASAGDSVRCFKPKYIPPFYDAAGEVWY